MDVTSAINLVQECFRFLHEHQWVSTGRIDLVRADRPIDAKCDGIIESERTARVVSSIVKELPTIEESEAIIAYAASPRLGDLQPSGNVCANCGSTDLKRSGTCETCMNCGATTGCG